jgi:hypothetical protein
MVAFPVTPSEARLREQRVHLVGLDAAPPLLELVYVFSYSHGLRYYV